MDCTRKNGRYPYCKSCNAANTRKHQRAAARTPEYRARKRRRDWLALLVRYGITEDQYHAILADQEGVCAICGREETFRNTDGFRPLSIDHDHVSGKVRGLLCHSCNVAVGHFRDSAAIMQAAILYLQKAA
jgi:Autographiviridae endonuclease VII